MTAVQCLEQAAVLTVILGPSTKFTTAVQPSPVTLAHAAPQMTSSRVVEPKIYLNNAMLNLKRLSTLALALNQHAWRTVELIVIGVSILTAVARLMK